MPPQQRNHTQSDRPSPDKEQGKSQAGGAHGNPQILRFGLPTCGKQVTLSSFAHAHQWQLHDKQHPNCSSTLKTHLTTKTQGIAASPLCNPLILVCRVFGRQGPVGCVCQQIWATPVFRYPLIGGLGAWTRVPFEATWGKHPNVQTTKPNQ